MLSAVGRCGEMASALPRRLPNVFQLCPTLRPPFGQYGFPSADRQVNNEGPPICYSISPRHIAQQYLVSCAPNFREFVVVGDSVRRVFTPYVALFLEVALRTAIDIGMSGVACGKIEYLQHHR